jgi:ABC-type Fe3+-siderophore transport system permease subunit
MEKQHAVKEAVLFGGVTLGLSDFIFWTSQNELDLPFTGFLGGLVAMSIIMTSLNNGTSDSARNVAPAGTGNSTEPDWRSGE